MVLFWSLVSNTASQARDPNRDDVVIVHLGDSTCVTSYLPKEQRVDAVLNARLAAHYTNQSVVSHNVGENGEYIRRFLDEGRYLREVRDKLKRIDIALIRYGQNDMKRFKPGEFKMHLNELCDRLQTDYPGVKVILETNTYIKGGNNERYNLYWEVTRQVAVERKLHLVDIYARRKAEVEAGNWDLCIRNQKLAREKYGHVIVDDSKDKEMTGVPDWFGDTHPNPNAVRIAAEEEFRVMTTLWSDLPCAEVGLRSTPR